MIEIISNKFNPNEIILFDEIKVLFKEKTRERLMTDLNSLVRVGGLKRFEKMMYYIPVEGQTPSISSIVYKKYLYGYNGIRVGDWLLYKYNLIQGGLMPTRYEVITNNVREGTTQRKMYDGQVLVSSGSIKINKGNIKAVEYVELLKYLSDNFRVDNEILPTIFGIIEEYKINKNDVLDVLKQYDYFWLKHAFMQFVKTD